MRKETRLIQDRSVSATPFSQPGQLTARAAEMGGKSLTWNLQYADSGPPRPIHSAQFPNFCLKFPTLSLTSYDLQLVTSPL